MTLYWQRSCVGKLLSWGRDEAELLHGAQGVVLTPVFDDFAVSDAEDGHSRCGDLLIGRRSAHKGTCVGAAESEAFYHFVAFGHQIFRGHLAIGKSGSKRHVGHFAAFKTGW